MEDTVVDEAIVRSCSAPGCMLNIQIAKRHYFRFPKESGRWMEWIIACDRMDLISLGPERTNQYYRLCHLHFRVEMFRNIEGKIYLSKEAVPSIFLKPILTGSDKSTELLQPISFVTIFLKPESRNKNSSKDLSISTKLSEMPPSKIIDNKDTPIISSLQALFPKASIKQTFEEKDVPTVQTSLLEVKSKCDNKNTSTAEICLVENACVDATASTSLLQTSSIEENNNRCTSINSLVPISSKTTLTVATQENGSRIPKRRRWHVSTQTPDAWLYIDSFLGKRRIEKSEICIETQAAKRRKMLPNAENEDIQLVNANNLKAVCTSLLPRNSALLVYACVDARKRRKAMRLSFEGKQLALELFFMAPDAYRFYRSLCLLPTVRQLWRHIRNWDMSAGLNDNVLNALRLKVKSLPAIERRCCLCVKEMRLRPHLFYNLSRDRIVGFHDTGVKKRRALAKKALVMMVRSMAGDWEQPIAYYFHDGICTADVTKNLILQAITKLRNIGVIVHVLVTGTAPIFLRLSRRLGISIECPSFLVDSEKVFYVFDIARLMRATRNILINHELRFREKKASWTDIKLFFRRDSQMRLPLIPQLSMAHFELNGCQKIETKYAVQVFSSAMAAGLSARITSGELPLKAVGTMEFVRNFSELFDILNSFAPTKSNQAKEYGQAFTGSTHEMCFLQRMLDFLKIIRVIDKNGGYVRSIGCFDRWQITINAVIQLWSVLKEHQFLFLRTARLNQEGIERTFRSIRRQSGDRARPTPILFIRAFKNLISKYLLEHSGGGDSTANTRRMLKRIAALSASTASTVSSSSRVGQQTLISNVQVILNVTSISYRTISPLLPQESAFKRLCEYLLDECSRAHNCDTCIGHAREARKLPENVPNSFSSYILNLNNIFVRNFDRLAAEENFGTRMLQLVQQVRYAPPCPNFPMALLMKLYLRLRIYIVLSRYNKTWKSAAPRDSLNLLWL